MRYSTCKIIFYSICLFALVYTTALAQRQRMTVEERIKTLSEQLELKPAQAESIKVLYVIGDSLRAKLFAEHQDDRGAVRDSMKKLNDEQDKKIEALLTEDQKTKYHKLIEERQKRFMPRREPRDQDNH